MIATVGAYSGRFGMYLVETHHVLMIVGSIIGISALVSSRSLATVLPPTVPLLYTAPVVPSIILLAMLTLPSMAGQIKFPS